jgi:hypothetical protein
MPSIPGQRKLWKRLGSIYDFFRDFWACFETEINILILIYGPSNWPSVMCYSPGIRQLSGGTVMRYGCYHTDRYSISILLLFQPLTH